MMLRDFQHNPVPALGIGSFNVVYKDFQGPLRLLVVKGHRTSLLGTDWFPALGIALTGVHHMQTATSSFEDILVKFAPVFSETLGRYKGPPVGFDLDPTVAPIRLKARRVPFALKPKIDTELDKLIAQGVLEPVSHAKWETPIVTPLKANGDVRICADYKCTKHYSSMRIPFQS